MLKFITTSKIWKFLVTIICDIRLYTVGIIFTGESSYSIKGPQVREVLDILEPGDVLLRRYNHYVGTMLTPGFWGHVGPYVGDNVMIHMGGEGIMKEDILTFLRADHIAVLRCKKPELIPDAIRRAKDLYDKDVEYDYAFESTNDTFYCSEQVWHNFGKPEEIKFDKYILPDDIVCDLFDIIRVDDKAKDKVKG